MRDFLHSDSTEGNFQGKFGARRADCRNFVVPRRCKNLCPISKAAPHAERDGLNHLSVKHIWFTDIWRQSRNWIVQRDVAYAIHEGLSMSSGCRPLLSRSPSWSNARYRGRDMHYNLSLRALLVMRRDWTSRRAGCARNSATIGGFPSSSA